MRKRDHERIQKNRRKLYPEGCTRADLEGLPVIAAGWIAAEGTAMLASEKEEELKARFHPDMVRAARGLCAEAAALPDIPACIRPLSEGGFLAGLWSLTEELDCGIRVDLKTVPVRQESIEICEYFGINPYSLLSGGASLIVTARERQTLDALAAAGVNAAVIGRLSSDRDCLMTCDGRVRFLNRPPEDGMDVLNEKTGGSGHAAQHCSART